MKKGDDYIMYNKIIHKYHDCDIKVIIEIPKQNEERDNDIIKEIKKNNE